MNGIFGLLFTMLIKMNILLLVIIWGLFHYTLVGINMELLCSFRMKALEGYCTKNSTVSSGHYMSKDGEFVQWYKREWTDYDAVKTTKQIYKILK
jgi:hypothetical protein